MFRSSDRLTLYLEMHIEYTCKKLSKCVGILCKLTKCVYLLSSAFTILLCTPILFIAIMYGENYPSCLARKSPIQNKLVRIITCPPFRAHTEPWYFAYDILNVCDINDYIIGSFMYDCLYGNIPDIFRNCFQRNADVHDHSLRNGNDLHIPYGRLDIWKFSIRVTGGTL